MKKIVRVKLSSNNDLLNDGEMKRIRGGYSADGYIRYNCTCKLVDSLGLILAEKVDFVCDNEMCKCCEDEGYKYNQIACYRIK